MKLLALVCSISIAAYLACASMHAFQRLILAFWPMVDPDIQRGAMLFKLPIASLMHPVFFLYPNPINFFHRQLWLAILLIACSISCIYLRHPAPDARRLVYVMVGVTALALYSTLLGPDKQFQWYYAILFVVLMILIVLSGLAAGALYRRLLKQIDKAQATEAKQ